MKMEKTNDEMLDELIKGIRRAEEEDDRAESLIENLWDDVELMEDLSEMLNRLSLYLRTYAMKRVEELREGSDEL